MNRFQTADEEMSGKERVMKTVERAHSDCFVQDGSALLRLCQVWDVYGKDGEKREMKQGRD
jgi:hypothetical protein